MLALSTALIGGFACDGSGGAPSERRVHSVRSESGQHTVELERLGDGRHADLHAWRVRIADASGAAIPAGPITFDGAMPAHRHGFDTRPQITHRDAEGWHRVEGVRFHMSGAWVLRVEFLALEGPDRAELPLEVPY
jgi:hypothetical protein